MFQRIQLDLWALSHYWVRGSLTARRGVVGAGFRAGAQTSAGWPAAPVIWSQIAKRMVISVR
ncbi:hypothetical protein GCM10009647_092580 [Streptomyces sanglieri]